MQKVIQMSQRQISENGEEKSMSLQEVFPCQPFSVAGQRKGADDNHYLWPHMLRAIHDQARLGHW